MRHFDLLPTWVDDETTTNALTGRFGAQLLSSEGTGFEFSYEGRGREVALRFIGCLIIGALPVGGVEEALTSLKDIYEFHDERQRLLPPAFAELVRNGTGVLASKGQRPPLLI